MAVNKFQAGGVDNNWSTIGNWSLGAVPTAGDGHVATFDATSPNCTVNAVARVCNNIDFTGYTNTITMTFQITVSGNITFSNTMNIAGSSQMIANATGTITSNGKAWPNQFQFAGTSQTFTLADDMNVDGTLALAGAAPTINGFSIYASGSLTNAVTTGVGSTTIVMDGTGTWSGSTQLANHLTFNTAGTITISGTVGFSQRTLTYTAGTMVVTGSTLSCAGGTTTHNTSGMTWNNITHGTSGSTCALLSDLNIAGNFSTGAATSTNFTGSFTIYVGGNLTIASNGSWTGASTPIVLNGTGTWSGAGDIRNNLTINTAGTITISGTVSYRTGTLTYTAGTMVVTSSTLSMTASGSLDTAGMTWNNFTCSLGITVTLVSNLNVGNVATLGSTTSTTTINGSNMNVSGNLVINTTSGIITGTTVINLVKPSGTQTWSHPSQTGAGALRNNLVINAGGTVAISGTVGYNTGTITYTAGTMSPGSSILLFGGTITVNATGFVLNTLQCAAASTFNGTSGFTMANWTCLTAGLTHTFKNGNTYLITSSITLTATLASPKVITSDSAGSQAIITYTGTSQDVYYTNTTDINSGLGYTIWDFKGTLSNATNWKALVPPISFGVAI